MPHMWNYLQRPEESVELSEAELSGCAMSSVSTGNKTQDLEEQQMFLTTELSL